MLAQAGASALPLGIPALGPQLRDALDLSLTGLGALLAAPTAGLALTLFGWGALSDRFGERAVLVGGLALSAAMLVAAAAVASSALALGVALVLAGAAGACAPAASGRAVVNWFPPTERGLALGLRHTAPMAGGALGAAVLPLAALAGGVPGAMIALAVLAAAGSAASLGVLEAPPGAPPPPGRVPSAAAPHPVGDAMVWRLAAGGAAVIVAQAALLRFQPAYLHDERGWSAGAAAALLAATLLVAALARVVAGVISDRTGRRIAVLRGQAIGAGLALLGAAVLLGLPSAVAAGLLVAAAVLSMAGNGVAYAAVAEVAPARTGAALGLYATVLIVVVTVTPAAFGVLAGVVPWSAAIAALAVFPLLGALAFRRAERAQARLAAPVAPAGPHPAASGAR
jgi:nitrate/nitrite transporter NarK